MLFLLSTKGSDNNMSGIEISIQMPRRRAEVTQDKHQAIYNKLDEGVHPCHVLGLFQCNDGDEDVNPYFICELNDGRCIYASPGQVRFVDTDEEGEML